MNYYNLNKLKNKKGKIWLNVASSTFVIKEYINLDNHIFLRFLRFFSFFSFAMNKGHKEYINNFNNAKKTAKLLVHDCRKRLKFPDNSVDHILCSHFLEHIFPNEMEIVLNDFLRCLKPGSTMHIIVPDINKLVKQYINESKNESTKEIAADNLITGTILTRNHRGSLRFRVLEFLGGSGLNHRWMYDSHSMNKKIIDVGFDIINSEETPSHDYKKNDGSVHIFAKKPH